MIYQQEINFKKKLISEFPYGSIENKHEFKPNITNDFTNKSFIKWIFTKKNTKKVELSYNKISLSYENNNYKSFEEFNNDIKIIINTLKSYAIIKVEYVKLRYINQLKENNHTNWEDYLDKTLHNITPSFTDNNNLQRNMHILEFKENDFNIHFQFGQFNNKYPSTLTKKEFILDYTCKYEEDINLNNVESIVEDMHNIISNLFERSINDKLRKLMKG